MSSSPKEPSEDTGAQPEYPPQSRGRALARGCAIAAGVALLLFALVFGSCFI